MANLFERISNIHDRLRHPKANRPADGDCLRSLCDHTKVLRAKRKNTGNPWDFADKRINVQAGTARYQIGDVRFGTPLAVVTVDDSNPNHHQRIIPFFAPANLAFSWGLPNNIANFMIAPDGSTHTAERVAFYWSNGVPYLEFQPMPAAAACYMVRFLVGNSVDAMSLTDPLSLGEVGDTLAEIRAATSLLPFAEWSSEPKNAELRKDIAMTLNWEESLFLEQYNADVVVHTGSNIGHLWSPE